MAFGLSGWCKKCQAIHRLEYSKKSGKIIKNRGREWRKKNREWLGAYSRNRKKMDREKINKAYIKLLIWKAMGLKAREITPELIKLKRQQVKLYRALREVKNDIRSDDSRA